MSVSEFFNISTIGLCFGFLISFVVGVLGTIINSILRFLKQY